MKKILLIEDDESLRTNISEMLTLSEFNPITAADGRSGIEKALAERPDLILCDVMMPGIDGYGVLNILSKHPETKYTPFIFLTGKKEFEDLRKGMGMGADDYLTKPFHEIELLQTIDLRLKKSEELKKSLSNSYQETEHSLNFHATEAHQKLTSANQETYRYKKKYILYSEGQKPTAVYYVLSGKLKEVRLHEDGKELITTIYCEGDFIGYRAVFEKTHYTETVQVIEDAELMLIPKKDFEELLGQDVHTANRFIGILSQNVRIKEEKLLNMAYNSLRKKVANGLIEVADKFNNKCNGQPAIEISREDLAHIIGSAQESLIRTLKDFKSEKLIDIHEGTIVILNDQKLRNLPY